MCASNVLLVGDLCCGDGTTDPVGTHELASSATVSSFRTHILPYSLTVVSNSTLKKWNTRDTCRSFGLHKRSVQLTEHSKVNESTVLTNITIPSFFFLSHSSCGTFWSPAVLRCLFKCSHSPSGRFGKTRAAAGGERLPRPDYAHADFILEGFSQVYFG